MVDSQEDTRRDAIDGDKSGAAVHPGEGRDRSKGWMGDREATAGVVRGTGVRAVSITTRLRAAKFLRTSWFW